MMTQLTRRERVLRTIRFEEVDRLATYDILDNDDVIEYYAREPLTPINGDRVKGKAIGRCLDMTRIPEGPKKPERLRDERGFVWQIERWTRWIVDRPFKDYDEFVPWVKGQILDLQTWRPGAEFREFFHEQIRRSMVWFAQGAPEREDVPILVIPSPAGLDRAYPQAGMELFTMLIYNDPDLADEWLDAINQAELRRIEAIADPELIPVVLTHDDLASKNGPLFNPEWIRQHEIPLLKRVVDAWHARDTWCLFHSDGNLMPILDDLVGTGIDGLNPIETIAGMSLGKVRELYPQLFMAGGIDVSQLLPYGTPSQVRERCLEAVRETQGRGYFLGSTTELLDTVPVENAVAMLETPILLASGKLLVES